MVFMLICYRGNREGITIKFENAHIVRGCSTQGCSENIHGHYHGELLKNEDLSQRARYLCLEQYSLGMQGAMTFFLLSSAKNYQALYQKAGIIGQRLYAVTSYLDIGCSGIGAYYDDEVNAFVEQEGMVLYALAIGR